MFNNFIIIVGVILIAIGTLLTYWGADRKSKETNDALKHSINAKNTQIDELVDGKDTLISQNEELRQKIEKYQNELEQKQKQIEELEELAGKDIYKPLAPEIKTSIITQLSSIRQIGLNQVLIDLFDVDNNGKRIASDLLNIFNQAGINSKIDKTGMSFGKSASSPRIKMNDSSKTIAEQLANALHPYLRVQFQGKIDNKLDDGTVCIEIHGIPLFHKNGSVEFQ